MPQTSSLQHSLAQLTVEATDKVAARVPARQPELLRPLRAARHQAVQPLGARQASRRQLLLAVQDQGSICTRCVPKALAVTCKEVRTDQQQADTLLQG